MLRSWALLLSVACRVHAQCSRQKTCAPTNMPNPMPGCLVTPGCGWCYEAQGQGQCLDSSSNHSTGPLCSSCNGTWLNAAAVCPACDQMTDCASCTSAPNCGWCSATFTCMTSFSPSGPYEDICPRGWRNSSLACPTISTAQFQCSEKIVSFTAPVTTSYQITATGANGEWKQVNVNRPRDACFDPFLCVSS